MKPIDVKLAAVIAEAWTTKQNIPDSCGCEGIQASLLMRKLSDWFAKGRTRGNFRMKASTVMSTL